MFAEILSALLPLFLIVALLYAVHLYIKKSGFKIKTKTNRILDFDVVANQMLMPKKYISVIRIKDKYLVLGVSESSINLLKEIDIETLSIDNETESEAKQPSFFEIFKKNLGLR